MKQILITSSVFFNQAAIIKDGKLEDFLYEKNDAKILPGSIYMGRVNDILPGINSAFVDISLDKNAYLHKQDVIFSDLNNLNKKTNKKSETKNISQVIKKGDEILVQVKREPMGEKGISVTTEISLKGKYIVFIPESKIISVSKKIKDIKERDRLKGIIKELSLENSGAIIRTYAQHISKEVIELEYKKLLETYDRIKKQYKYSYPPKLMYEGESFIEKIFFDYVDYDTDAIYTDDKNMKKEIVQILKTYGMESILVKESKNIFEVYDVKKYLDELSKRKIELCGGGSIFIDITEALTVIDVNSGGYIGKFNMEETALDFNLIALEEIARQIKLRNISGIIIIDFINLKNGKSVEILLKKAKDIFRKDISRVSVLGMTKLNLMEITRERKQDTFYNFMYEKCQLCDGSGMISTNLRIMLEIENIVKRVKENTSSEFVEILVNKDMYNKMIKENIQDIKKIQNSYNIEIHLKESTDEGFIKQGSIGKLIN